MRHIDEDDIVRRLHALGEQPIDPGVAHRHTSLFGGSPVEAGRRRRPAVTAAFLAGIVLGGTGLAAAGPGDVASQASDVAKSALAKVNLVDDEPKTAAQVAAKAAAKTAKSQAKAARAQGKPARIATHNGPHGTARFYAGCFKGNGTPFTSGNHGQYVKSHPDLPGTAINERQVAAEKDCGKPLASLNTSSAGATAKAPKTNSPTDAEQGKPESPGKSEENRPPTAGATARVESDGPGKAEEHRPADAGPTTARSSSSTTSSSTTSSSTTSSSTTSSSTP